MERRRLPASGRARDEANHALLAWAIANEISQRQGPVVILTPDAGNAIIRAALDTVQTKQYTRKNGATFGPYPHTWDRHDNEEADALLADIALPERPPAPICARC